jgi:hypothetical protein
MLAAWIFWISGTADIRGKGVYSFLFYGLFYYSIVVSVFKLEFLDDLRWSQANDATFPGTFSNSENKKALAGTILEFAGIFILCIFVVHGKFDFRCRISPFLFAIAVAVDIIGVIILWNLDSAKHGNTPDNRTTIFFVATSMTIILVVLFGSVFCERPDGAYFTAAFLAISGIWFLSDGFLLKSRLTGDDDQISKSWAGTIFCWLSAWTALVCARFAASHHVVIVTQA